MLLDDILLYQITMAHPLFFRSKLTKKAEKSSIEVFAENVKNLLLSAPLKGHTILALDPGFTNGCKTAVISDTGSLFERTRLI